MDHLEALTPHEENMTYALEFVSYSARFFDKEDQREEILRYTLKSLLSGKSEWQEPMVGGVIVPGGVWFERCAMYMIFQLKNEPGIGGDPFLQSLAVYSKIIQQKEVSPPSPSP